METEKNSVRDEKRKLTAEELGRLQVKTNEIVKRIEKGVVSLGDALDVMQKIIIEGKSPKHLDVIKGLAEIVYPENIIDCDASPFIPDGLSVEDHKKGGLLKFDPAKFFLYLSKKQKKGMIGGHDLREELSDKPTMNANVLDYLLAHPELIPERWKGKNVFFWGTVYRCSNGDLSVRYLYWYNSKWSWGYNRLDVNFLSGCPAALISEK